MTEQELYKNLGENGCYIFCLKHIAEKTKKRHINIYVTDYETWEHYNWVDSECFVFHPEELLRYWTGKKWEVRKERAEYEKKPNEEIVECWQYKTNQHFCMTDYGRENSNCVKYGSLLNVRVATMV